MIFFLVSINVINEIKTTKLAIKNIGLKYPVTIRLKGKGAFSKTKFIKSPGGSPSNPPVQEIMDKLPSITIKPARTQRRRNLTRMFVTVSMILTPCIEIGYL